VQALTAAREAGVDFADAFHLLALENGTGGLPAALVTCDSTLEALARSNGRTVWNPGKEADPLGRVA
jgi:hypothetical protein